MRGKKKRRRLFCCGDNMNDAWKNKNRQQQLVATVFNPFHQELA